MCARKELYKIIGHLYMMRKKYTNVAIPEELAKEIDSFIKKSKLGFRSRAEFTIEAIRNKLKK